MSGIPQFNFPLFNEVAHDLRNQGWVIINPAENDPEDVQEAAAASKDGKYDENGKVGHETWGDMLSRDVKLIVDGADATHLSAATGAETPVKLNIEGAALLPGWEKSRGARLEMFVMVDSLKDKSFFIVEEPVPGGPDQTNKWGLRCVDREWIMYTLSRAWADGIKMHTPLP